MAKRFRRRSHGLMFATNKNNRSWVVLTCGSLSFCSFVLEINGISNSLYLIWLKRTWKQAAVNAWMQHHRLLSNLSQLTIKVFQLFLYMEIGKQVLVFKAYDAYE